MKKEKGTHIEEEEVKLSLFADNMTMYVGNFKESTTKQNKKQKQKLLKK